jgi:hypothetical protein
LQRRVVARGEPARREVRLTLAQQAHLFCEPLSNETHQGVSSSPRTGNGIRLETRIRTAVGRHTFNLGRVSASDQDNLKLAGRLHQPFRRISSHEAAGRHQTLRRRPVVYGHEDLLRV